MTARDLGFHQASTSQHVANALRNHLLEGLIPPGAKLREVPLAKTLGVSRHTLRAGFRILEAEGLLDHALNRGVIVPELSDDRIADVFRARKALEFAGIHAIDPSDSDHPSIAGMVEAVDRMRAAGSDGELAAADLAYHSAVVAAVNSKMIGELYRNIQAQLRLTRAWTQRSRGNRALMVETHGEVVVLLQSMDVSRASEALMHINDLGEEALLKAMSQLDRTLGSVPPAWPPDPD